MPANVLVDAGFLVGLLDRRDTHHGWARAIAAQFPPPWHSAEAVLSEAFYLLGPGDAAALIALLRRTETQISLALGQQKEAVLGLMEKYADLPMSLADACLVRMTEVMADPLVLTTDTHFLIYRRHSRQVIPCVLPS